MRLHVRLSRLRPQLVWERGSRRTCYVSLGVADCGQGDNIVYGERALEDLSTLNAMIAPRKDV